MRHATQLGIDLVKQFEGFSPRPYLCPAGHLTIGYGHLVKDHETFYYEIGQEQGEYLLKKDLESAERAVSRLARAGVSDSQFDALVSFTYNLGAGAFQRSTLRRKVNRGEDPEVPAEFLRWVWAGGRRLRGLIRRRQAEAVLYCL